MDGGLASVGRSSGTSGAESDGFLAGLRNQGDVGELTVVSRTLRIQAVEVQRVGVLVVTSDGRDSGGMVPGVDQRVVVNVHLETVGVLIDERAVFNGVGTTRESRTNKRGESREVRLDGGVVRPFAGEGVVAGSEEQSLDGMREANVVLRLRVVGGVESLAGSSLDLFDEDITRSTSHTLTFIVGDDGVVSENVAVVTKSGGTVGNISRLNATRDDSGNTGVEEDGIDNEEFGPVAELELDSHFIVGEGGSGESNTRVTSEEEGEGDVEGVGGESLNGPCVNEASRGQTFTSELGNVTNHIVVTDLLGGGDSEGSPEVKMVVVEASSNQIVERNAAFTDKIVADVLSPADGVGTSLRRNSGSGGTSDQSDGGEGNTQPGVEEVVTSTGDGDGPFSSEFGSTSVTAQDDGDLSEPGGLAGFANEISGSITTTIHVLLELVISSEIDKTRGKITCANRS